jgi:rRNA-processing protein EBP2
LKRKQPEPAYSDDSDNEDLDLVMEDDQSGSDQEDDQLIPALDKPKKTYINDEAALEEKLDEIKLRIPNMKVIPWEELLDVTSTVPIQVANPNDDLEREAAFYTQVKDTVTMAINKLESEGTPWRRPDDYFAEMLKTDEHMLRVKDKLLGEKARVEKSNEARKMRENKKFSKKVQQEKLASREKQKKEDLDAIKKWRKQHGSEGEEFDMDMFNKSNGKDNKNNNNNNNNSNSRGPKRNANHKRMAKDSKYGFGGKKSGRKRNDASSSGDTSGWSTRRNRDMKGFVSPNKNKQGKPAANAGGSRPGKRARQGQTQGNKRPNKRQRTH